MGERGGSSGSGVTFGVALLMHKEERGDMARTTSFMHTHEPPTQVTEVVQHRGRSVGPAGLAELISLTDACFTSAVPTLLVVKVG